MQKFVIIDGNAIIHRAYHAIPPLTTKDGVMVNAVYGFTSMMLKVINDLKPEYLTVTFDVAGGSKLRLEKFADYKATRVKADQELYNQIPLAHEVVNELGISLYEKQGYEADDVIGTVVEKLKKQPDLEIYIVTGDVDMYQLVNHTVKVYKLRKGLSDTVVVGANEVHEQFGFGPERIVDYKALRGDASDNIPGVPGVGEKTASELIQKIGGIEEIYTALKAGSLKEVYGIRDSVIAKLVAGEVSARLSHDLATIDRQVPDLDFTLEKAKVPSFDKDKAAPLFQKFEFISLLKRLPGVGESDPQKTTVKKAFKIEKEAVLVEIKDDTRLSEVLKAVQEKKICTAKVIMGGKDFFTGSIEGILIIAENKAYYGVAQWMQKLLPLFSDTSITVIGHDLKQLIKAIHYHGKTRMQVNLFDVMIASYLLHPGSRAHDAASVVLKVLGKALPAGSGQESLFGVDIRVAAHELYLIAQAAEQLRKDLADTNDEGLLKKMEMPLELVLAEMELNGVAVDKTVLAKLSIEVADNIQKVTKRIFKEAGEEFNISSPIQLREILFEKMAIPTDGIKKGKTGLSTSADELEKIRSAHPVVEDILCYRELTKLQNTYIDVLPTLINTKTGRIHTTFNQAVTATGRLSSSDPNLQNIPIRSELGKEIRNTFIAEEGYELISADYSQIELRIVASLAQDKHMMEIFEKDEDIHTATAAAIHGIPLDKVTKDIRRTAKEINFGVLYGMGVHGLSWRAQISYAEAKEFIDKYFEQFSGVKKYMDSTLAFAKKEGFCETLFGRRRYIPELNSSNYQLRSTGERMAINHPVQGTAADLMKMAMINVHEVLSKEYSQNDVKLTLQVHDEIVLEVKKDLVTEVMEKVQKIMEGVVKLRVPVKVEVGRGKRWGELK